MTGMIRTLTAFAIGVAVCAQAGCHFWGVPPIPDQPRADPAIPYDISQTELIQLLNQNADRVDSWISHECHLAIKTPKLPVRLKATIGCAEPRNFRLIADGSLVVRADVGSNKDFCWWQMQPGENVLFTVTHNEMDYVRNHPLMKQTMSMPFEPEWLMAVLGVTGLDPNGVVMHHDPHPERVNLVSEHTGSDGKVFRRVTKVDLHAGHIISHRIVDSASNTVARAELSNYVFEGGASLPSRIKIDWPTMEMSLTINVKGMQVNSPLSSTLWQPPPSNRPRVNLSEHLRRVQTAPHRFKPIEMRPGNRPIHRDSAVEGVDYTADGEKIVWGEDPPKKKFRWFRWPFSRRKTAGFSD